MQLRFILESNSNKKLDTLTKAVLSCVEQTGAVKSGPVCFKNKKLIDIHNPNGRTIDFLTKIPKSLTKGVVVTVEQL
jgi:ribosomal protein S10